METFVWALIILVILIIIGSFSVAHAHNKIYYNFLNGFWLNDPCEENSIILYMNNNDSTANIIIGRDGQILSDQNYSYTIKCLPKKDIDCIASREDIKKCIITFELNSETSETISDPYTTIFVDQDYEMSISINQGFFTLNSDEHNMILYKDNVMTNQLINYVTDDTDIIDDEN